MKKIAIILLLFLSFIITGCDNKTQYNSGLKWKNNASAVANNMPKQAKKAYKLLKNKELNFIALLATQEIEGTNYLYLANDKTGNWKFVTIYLDSYKNATLTNVYDFNYLDYVDNSILENSSKNNNWNIYNKGKRASLNRIINKDLKIILKNEQKLYKPIAVLGTKDNNYNEYALFCLIKDGEDFNFNVLTIKKDKENPYIKAISVVDIEEF